MKKMLLFAIAIGCVFSVNAQKSQFHNGNLTPIKKDLTPAVRESTIKEPASTNAVPYKDIKTSTLIPFTSSANGYTLLSGTKLTADQQTKTVLYTSRSGGNWGGSSLGNDIKMKMTTDYGTTFDSVMFANGISHRYPGGTLFRNGSDLYTVSAGPITTGSGWTNNYIFSSKIDGTQAADTTFTNPPNTGIFHMNELATLSTGELFVLGELIGPSPDYDHINYTIWKLKWNTTENKFNFVSSYEFTPLFSKTMPPVQPYGMAFAKDGSVGYFWVNAMDSITHPNLNTQPLVWKTTDKGDTWNAMPIYDFSQVQELKDYCWPTLADTTILRPVFFYGYTTSEKVIPGTVDAQGNLHLIANIVGGYSSDPDSLGFTYSYEPNKIFDLYTTATGWEAKYIDSLSSEVDDGTGGIFGDFDIDHRLHVGKTEDGKKVFAMWTDTDPSYAPNNVLPNFKAWGIDIISGYFTASTNFSALQSDDGLYLYMNASNIIIDDAGTYKIPVVIINGIDPANSPIEHIYVSGLEFFDTDFVGINETTENSNLVSQNFPNPFNGSTNIVISLAKASNLSITVSNLIGQKVYEINKGNVSAGNHQITINCSNLNSGIYFYTLNADGKSVTRKMIVE